MNLQKAAKHHRNIIVSFLGIFAFVFFVGNGIEYDEYGNATDINLGFALAGFSIFLFQVVSFVLLAKELDKNRFLWGITSFLSPYLFFIPFLVLILSANKTFKANGWKVRFLGGAACGNNLPNKSSEPM